MTSDQFAVKKPCPNCPFRKVGGVRVAPERAEEITDSILDDGGGEMFLCHKTVYGKGRRKGKFKPHCAGALMFAEKHGVRTQSMQLAERLLGFKVPVDEEGVIFDDRSQMVEACRREG